MLKRVKDIVVICVKYQVAVKPSSYDTICISEFKHIPTLQNRYWLKSEKKQVNNDDEIV